MTEFHLPYQYIPATGKIHQNGEQSSTAQIDFSKILSGTGNHNHARHDVWLNGTLSGKITCRVHLETPLVIGARHEEIAHLCRGEDCPKRVIPYKYNSQYAIPGNSLRGMVASIAEMISQSALRVLENKKLSIYDWSTRQRESVGDIYDYFPPNILPLSDRRRKAGNKNGSGLPLLTPAEILFGVAEEDKVDDENAIALQSRLRFHDALPLNGTPIKISHEVTLKILDSPKPPAPAMRFRDKYESEQFIAKTDLNKNDHEASGRNIYLHHQQSDIVAENWITAEESHLEHLKMKCKPIEAGQDFIFTIDFDNLTRAELKLLETSLSPDEDFCHRLGLGKPLGLGSIRISINNTHLRDSSTRYNLAALNAEQDNNNGEVTDEDANEDSLIDIKTLQLLRTVGKRSQTGESWLMPGVPVRYPFMNNPNEETELYQWFAENEKLGSSGDAQVLKDIEPSLILPTLYTHGNPPPAPPPPAPHIRNPGEMIDGVNQQLRKLIGTVNQRSFNDLIDENIADTLVSLALAKLWKNCPEDENDEKKMKQDMKQLILDSVSSRGMDNNYWFSGGSKRAKRIYDNWNP